MWVSWRADFSGEPGVQVCDALYEDGTWHSVDVLIEDRFVRVWRAACTHQGKVQIL
jgi:hypothetical protein